MSLAIHAVDLFLYDLHIALGPLGDSSLLRPESAFLVDPEGYEEAHRTGATFETRHFLIRPLRRELGGGRLPRNYFWHYYSEIGLPGMRTANHWHWHLLIPFRCRPKDCEVRLVCDRLGLEAPVRPTILLWPFGWSINLEVSLTGDLSPRSLQEIVAAFRADGLFRVSSFGPETVTGLSGVFRRLTRILREDLYTDPRIGEKRPISRQWVISFPGVRLPGGRLSDRQRIELHGVLLGKQLTPEEMAELAESPEGFLLTPLVEGDDFGMTDFDRGTLLFLANAAAAGKSRASLYSLGANVRSCSLVGQALLHLLKSGRKWAQTDSKIQALCETAAAILYELPEYYTNPFCTRYFTTHRDLVRERERYAKSVEGSGE